MIGKKPNNQKQTQIERKIKVYHHAQGERNDIRCKPFLVYQVVKRQNDKRHKHIKEIPACKSVH